MKVGRGAELETLMKLGLSLALFGLAACGRTPQPRDTQAEMLAREKAELHILLNKTRSPSPPAATPR